MMYRHIIAPSRGFSQFSHDIIRHPRLNSDAVRLLTWQLSLPASAPESLSRTAERARIGACAFARAKRQLKAEGFVHERRVQGPGGRWTTRQLVTNLPLNAAEAAKLLARLPLPSAGIPAVGEPAAPPTDGHPKKDRVEDTSNRPPEPEPEGEPEPEPEGEPEPEPEGALEGGPEAGPEAQAAPQAPPPPPPPAARSVPSVPDVPDEARALVAALPLLSPALRHIPRGMRDELAGLAADWLSAGHSSADVHAHVLRGLPGDGTPVYRPGGLVRYLLREVPPLRAAPPAGPAQRTGPRLSARLAAARECEGEHVQPMLFRPVADETLCAACTASRRQDSHA
ncbi:hypothetical protein [Streptomyces roseoviridis]|uniref:Helix-turn-helix domain-containing protein n=1 Tax=Streptomyces roseoviridis TaxID=67361 RepID=A0ABV5QPK8_9ACTN